MFANTEKWWMEVYKSILKIQGRSLRLALEASVAETKGHTATLSLERQAGRQLLPHKDQSRPKRWRAQWPLRTHLGPSRVELRTPTPTARRAGPRGLDGWTAPAAAAAVLLASRRGQYSSGEKRPPRLPTRPKPKLSSFSRPCALRASVTFCSVSAARCARGKEGRLAQRPVTIRASELGSPPSRFGRLLAGYRVS